MGIVRLPPIGLTFVLLAIGGAFTIACVYAVVIDPVVGIGVTLSPLLLYAILTRSWARAVAVIGGGMVVLGGSEIGSSKVIYAVIVLLSTLVSAYRIMTAPPAWAPFFRPLLGLGAAFMLVLVIGALLGVQDGTPFEAVVRQSIFYLLIIAAPLIGIDAGSALKPQTIYAVVWSVGLIAAVGFATDWLTRRGVSSIDVGQFVLSSLVLPAFAFSLALVQATLSAGAWRRVLWVVPLVVIPVALLVTGTRTNLIVFAAVLGVIGTTSKYRVPLRRMFMLVSVCLLAGLSLFPLVVSAVVSRPEFIQQRISYLLQLFSGNLAGDQSYALREQQNTTALRLIEQRPLFGHGVGYGIGQTLDTPLATVVKLGIVGTISLLVFLVVAVVLIEKLGQLHGYSAAQTAVRGLIVVLFLSIPFGTPLEDHGFGFTLLLMFTAVASEMTKRYTLSGPLISTQRVGPRSTSGTAPSSVDSKG
ncbi:hypothetical protein [Cryobacterium sp. PH29-G1]|uniref:O-antigen ligase family protein n=1 Tax=Cryobacterium sp. PH29-G1 TaxID=3046211 RepID=UPI0024B9705C|nr:hypothetical protein [Cryobacterium sp. PH29-G1]MDJ0350803.1 hypothetical protein [Cryobacterium sp. PH29-G1]